MIRKKGKGWEFEFVDLRFFIKLILVFKSSNCGIILSNRVEFNVRCFNVLRLISFLWLCFFYKIKEIFKIKGRSIFDGVLCNCFVFVIKLEINDCLLFMVVEVSDIENDEDDEFVLGSILFKY